MNFDEIAPPDEPEMLVALSMTELEQVADKLNSLYTEDFVLAAHKMNGQVEQDNEAAANETLSWRQFRPLFEESFVDQAADIFEFSMQGSSTQLKFEQIPRMAARVDGDIPLVESASLGCETEAISATGAVIWDSSLVVARYLELCNDAADSPFKVRGKKCFELGAGCGLLSCVLWHLGAKAVIAAERSEILPLLSRNVEYNCRSVDAELQAATTMGFKGVEIRNKPLIMEHMWGDLIDPSSLGGPLDMIFAVDCIYDESAAEVLFQSLGMLSAKWDLSSTTVLIAVDESYKRPRALARFMSLIEDASLQVKEISLSGLENDYPETVKVWSIQRQYCDM